MLPNRFPDAGTAPEYNTVDATLWYFAAVYRYVEATGDIAILRDSLWSVLEQSIRYHQQGTRYNIRVDADHLLYAGQQGVQLTWMDAKVGDWVVTPRIGKPVEINALWHNALKTMAYFARFLGREDAYRYYEGKAQKTAAIFASRFARHDGRGLYDVLDTPNHHAPDKAIRPNQIFAVSLPFPPLASDTALASRLSRQSVRSCSLLLTPEISGAAIRLFSRVTKVIIGTGTALTTREPSGRGSWVLLPKAITKSIRTANRCKVICARFRIR